MRLFRWSVGAILALSAAGLGVAPALADPASAWSRNDHAAVRLISASVTTGTAEVLRLGLEFRLAPGWKTYWRTPGDAGFPPRIDWAGSTNLGAATLRWPAPMRFELFGLDTFGYGDTVVFPIDIKPERTGEAIALNARVDYLVCEKICVPYEASFALRLPAGPLQPSEHAHLISQFNSRVPGEGGGGIAIDRAVLTSDAKLLIVSARGSSRFEHPDVFVEGPSGWSFGRPSVTSASGGSDIELRVPVRHEGANGATLIGAPLTLTLVDGDRAAEQRVAVTPGAPRLAERGGLLGMVALAILGGLILNLMPCVLPVLSLKLLNVVRHAGAARATIRLNFLASAAGIIASFLALAGGLIALKASGHTIGWGIQFQEPLFLVLMTLLLVLFAANLWGWFEIRLPDRIAGALANAPDEGSHIGGAFLTGAFATLLSTPCSAPFLGTAVGFALAGGTLDILVVFAALGIGLALPYLAVALVPAIANHLPRPGLWMVALRRVLGVALLGTALWLLTVLAAQVDAKGLAVLAIVMLVLLGFLWVVREAGTSRGRLRVAGIVVLAALAFLVPSRFANDVTGARADAVPGWRAFDRGEIDRLVTDGNVVLVDVTADWCITCQVNKSLVLSRGEVAARLAGQGPLGAKMIAMRADWTRPDPRIAEYLASFGRYGIPFNAVYGPAAPTGIALPELLTADIVLGALDRAAGGSNRAALPATPKE